MKLIFAGICLLNKYKNVTKLEFHKFASAKFKHFFVWLLLSSLPKVIFTETSKKSKNLRSYSKHYCICHFVQVDIHFFTRTTWYKSQFPIQWYFSHLNFTFLVKIYYGKNGRIRNWHPVNFWRREHFRNFKIN